MKLAVLWVPMGVERSPTSNNLSISQGDSEGEGASGKLKRKYIYCSGVFHLLLSHHPRKTDGDVG
jgi:hypothetical protein